MKIVERQHHVAAVKRLLRQNPVVAVLGARQVGKTTLARELAARERGRVTVFDLENPTDLARLDDPMLALEDLRGLVVLDEIQRRPELFPVLRVLVDRPPSHFPHRSGARFLVLGSASPDLLRQTSESLAGRIAFYELPGFSLLELEPALLDRLWLRGGFPRSYLARSGEASLEWRRNFIRTFLERDLAQLGVRIGAQTLRRFWTMLAHYHGQVWNASELGRAFGVADTTVRHYLDILAATFMVRTLAPWRANIRKRQVKAPKVYLTDSGILHALLDINAKAMLEGHPKVGASWEGFMLETVVQRLGVWREQCFFWRTHAGAELDLLVVRGRQRLGFEFKRTTAPRITPSMRATLVDLKLARLDVLHAGRETFQLDKRVRAVAASRVLEDLKPL